MLKILIVDDLSVDRFLLKSILNSLLPTFQTPYQMHEEMCGVEAVEEARNSHFDIIFIDIVMPRLSGIEATQKIRSFDKSAIIVGMSAVDDPQNQKKVLHAGADYFIEKPIYGDVLLPLVSEIMNVINAKKETL